jgi:hypothetical protein
MRFVAIPCPIIPSPINPIFLLIRPFLPAYKKGKASYMALLIILPILCILRRG